MAYASLTCVLLKALSQGLPGLGLVCWSFLLCGGDCWFAYLYILLMKWSLAFICYFIFHWSGLGLLFFTVFQWSSDAGLWMLDSLWSSIVMSCMDWSLVASLSQGCHYLMLYYCFLVMNVV